MENLSLVVRLLGGRMPGTRILVTRGGAVKEEN